MFAERPSHTMLKADGKFEMVEGFLHIYDQEFPLLVFQGFKDVKTPILDFQYFIDVKFDLDCLFSTDIIKQTKGGNYQK